MTTLPLALSLDHVAALLGRARAAHGLAQSLGDPFLIDLPPMGGGGGDVISESSIEITASLYFAAEIEATVLPAVAEQLALNRFTLNLTDRGAADAMEALAAAMRDAWVDRTLRNQIFLRCFGIGEAEPNLGDSALNREFEPLFARLCAALAASSRDLEGWGAPAGAAMRAAVAAQAVLGNLGGRLQGNTLIVTERLTRQLQLSIAALNHPGMAALFMGRSAWDVVRGVLGPDTPDLTKPVTRAQTGLRLLSWVAVHLAAIQNADAQGLIQAIVDEPGLSGWAELWLDASGIAVSGQAQGRLQ
jgi:hypothetical protein